MERSDGPFLSYDVNNGTHRSAAEEWRPHQTQTDRAFEWWYFTSLLNDVAGTQYFLFWCVFHVSGKRHLQGGFPPDGAARLKPGQSAYVCFSTLTNYQTGARTESPVMFIVPDNEVWDDATSALRLHDAQHAHECTWSFDGEKLRLTTKSPALSFDLQMHGGSQVMWAKDHLGKEGLIQEGAEDDRSFYYSLPRLQVTGSISYTDETKQPTTAEIGGFGWIDRQWGDFMTTQWEWASFRFNSGARLNLYNFPNAYQVATYQKADGSTQWFDNFVVKQNGYAKTPAGTWVSFGWSYEFPIEVEASQRYTLVPFSTGDMIDQSAESFFEGPSHLTDDSTGKRVGISVNESMDVRAMGNAPYGPHQH